MNLIGIFNQPCMHNYIINANFDRYTQPYRQVIIIIIAGGDVGLQVSGKPTSVFCQAT